MEKKPIAILLGTYNGGHYLSEQIESVLGQTFQGWQLLIRDDGSEDNTLDIINTFQRKDSRIHLVSDDKGNMGTPCNYNELCQIALRYNPDTVFFCDQDDIWLPQKIETQINTLQQIENRYGKGCPILVHSDLMVVDVHLKRIHRSFLTYQGIKNINQAPLRMLLAQNYITACASAFNHALLKLATPIPDGTLMHDWWLALCGAACGKIGFIGTPLTLYRQHHNNAVGAKGLLNSINPFRKDLTARWRNGRAHFIQSVYQAHQLEKRIRDHNLTVHTRVSECINTYANCLKLGTIKRLKAIQNNGIQRQGIVYGFFFYLLLLLSSEPSKPDNKTI